MSWYKSPALPKVAQSSRSREKNTMEFWFVLGFLVLLAKPARLRDAAEDYHPTTQHGGNFKIIFIAVALLFFVNQIVPLFSAMFAPKSVFPANCSARSLSRALRRGLPTGVWLWWGDLQQPMLSSNGINKISVVQIEKKILIILKAACSSAALITEMYQGECAGVFDHTYCTP